MKADETGAAAVALAAFNGAVIGLVACVAAALRADAVLALVACCGVVACVCAWQLHISDEAWRTAVADDPTNPPELRRAVDREGL